MCSQTTCTDTCSAISLPESADGLSPSSSQDGPLTDRCGQGAALVSRLARQVADAEVAQVQTSTFGPIGSASSGLDALLPSLANRLPMPLIGSLRCGVIWKEVPMPSGLPISRLARSGLTTYGREFGFLHTPTCAQNMSAPSMQKHKCCRGVIVSAAEFCRRMGYPADWLSAAPAEASATPSSRKSLRK